MFIIITAAVLMGYAPEIMVVAAVARVERRRRFTAAVGRPRRQPVCLAPRRLATHLLATRPALLQDIPGTEHFTGRGSLSRRL